MTLVIYLATCY